MLLFCDWHISINKLTLCRSVLQVKKGLNYLQNKIRNLLVRHFQGETNSTHLKLQEGKCKEKNYG